jgi:hypothetical protein
MALVGLSFMLACASQSPHITPPVETANAMAPRPDPDAIIAREVSSSRITYVFRASRAANLLYALDCASGMTRCSRDAYEEGFAPLDGTDRAALRSWKDLHARYSGNVVSDENVADALDRMAIFLEPADVGRAQQVIHRFTERFEKQWRARHDELAAKVDAFAALMSRPDVIAIVESVARFYEPDLPEGTRETIELVARPKYPGGDFGEQLADHALVETRIEEHAEDRIDVVLHELFHRWFASAPSAKKRALAEAFASSSDPMARAAYGLLNESLAAAFGNGFIQRAVNRKEFDKRMGYALGIYHDRYIDPTVKALLPPLETYLASGKTLYDPEFLEMYLRVVSSTFPKGPAPVLTLRPMVSAYESSFEEVEQQFYDLVGGNWIESESTLGAEGRALIAKHPTWGAALVVFSAHVDQLQGVEKSIDAHVMTTLHKEVATHKPFVLTIPRVKASPLFVFVAETAESMHALMERFVALDAVSPGVWR